ncbi:hypothetical protein K4L44_06640 [Halosquirtibacter laminarini]|uniref:Uncharacterized protein n=1 Tax=Halosquirtibacter laminarini TaxID=3374600 RepID=A0AC61NRA7_9BACT|nr:hypothetical protein K4L44_06640 [Prolixibacteraceae bacterium]
MKRFTTLSLMLLFIITLFSSCTQRLLDFTMISSKNIDLTHGADFQRGPKRVDGADKIHYIICFPTGVVNIKEALDRAIESTPGCVALLDGVIYCKYWYIPLIYGQYKAIVEGTPLIDPQIKQTSSVQDNYRILSFDKKGKLTESRSVDAETFAGLTHKMIPMKVGDHVKN